MSIPHIPPIDAELALAEVQIRREQVIDTNLVPSWFWPSLGGLVLVFVAAVESMMTWLIVVGTVIYAIGLATLVITVVRRARVQVSRELLGLRGFLAIVGFALGLVAVGVGLGLTLDAAGAPWPATISCLPVALGLAVGGPLLMAHLRRIMLSRPLGGPR